MKNKRIFIVEDESIVSLEIQSRLNYLGFEIAGTADNGEDAIRKILESEPDLVMMDIKIKGNLDGIQTAAKIKEQLDVPIVYLTAFADDATVERAKVTDPFGYLIKPFEERELQITIDIALYKHETQKQIREKDKWLSTVLFSVGDGVIATDEFGSIRFMNNVAERLTGYSSTESIGKNLTDVYKVRSEETKEPILNPYEEVLEKGDVIGLANHTELIKKSGEAFPIMDAGSPIKDDKGKIIGVVVVFQDMTYYRSTENLLHLQTSAMDAAYNGIVITDKDGLTVWANESIERLIGYKRSEIFQKNMRLLKSNMHDDNFYKNLWETITKGDVWQGEVINKRKDNSLYNEEMTITPIKDYKGEITNFVAIKSDITDRKKAEKELIEAKENAERADKLKGEFLAQISHEIRTPLNILMGFADIIKSDISENLLPDTENLLNGVEQAGKRITRTMDALVNIAQLKSGNYKPRMADIHLEKDIIQKYLAEWKLYAGSKNIGLTFDNKSDTDVIVADNYSLTASIINIVENAIKFTATGSVNIAVSSDIKKIYLEVIDTGIGISEEYLNNIYEPFSQEAQGFGRRYDGNGLGLALANQWCELNNVGIDVISKKGEGTTFKLTFDRRNGFNK